MFRKYYLLWVFSWATVGVNAQPNNYTSKMNALYDSIQSSFYLKNKDYYKEIIAQQDNKVSYLWPLCAMLDATGQMGAVTSNYGPFNKVLAIIKKYKSLDKPAPAYASYPVEYGGGSRFYDDNQWLGITAMEVYSRTQERPLLYLAKEVYTFMMTGYDTLCGGGLYWQEDKKTTKNACSNAPGIVLALMLYKSTRQQKYLATAQALYQWAATHLKSADGLYYDNIRISDAKIDTRKYAYNAGTMLQSAVLLYQITKDKRYLQDALKTAASSKEYFLQNGKFKDSWWFNAVLLRGYIALWQCNKDSSYIVAFQKALNNLLQSIISNGNIVYLDHNKDLVAYGGLLEMAARFARLEKEINLIN